MDEPRTEGDTIWTFGHGCFEGQQASIRRWVLRWHGPVYLYARRARGPVMLRRQLVLASLSAVFAATAGFAGSLPTAALSSTIPISIAPTMTLSGSTAEVEFPVTVTCDNIGAFDSYVYVHLQQDQTGATGSGEVRPLVCDSTPHQYLVH